MRSDQFVEVTVPGIEGIIKATAGIPHAAGASIFFAIRDALKVGRTALLGRGKNNAGITSRYSVGYNRLLEAVGNPTVNGMTGVLNIQGPRLPLAMFPHKDIYPYGVAIQELQPAAGLPINLLHAFVTPGGGIYQREGPGAASYPIRWIMGLSIAEMAHQADVSKKVEKAINDQLPVRLFHYMDLFIKQTMIANRTPRGTYTIKKPPVEP